MAVTLGTVTLSDHLILAGIENAPPVAISQKRTLGGRSVVTSAPTTGGRVLTLSGEHHYTQAQLDAVRVLAALGQPVTLTHHRGIFTVLITGISVEPSLPHSNPDATEWYSGDITLIEV